MKILPARIWIRFLLAASLVAMVVVAIAIGILARPYLFPERGEPVERRDLVAESGEARVTPSTEGGASSGNAVTEVLDAWSQAQALFDATDLAISQLDAFECELHKQERIGTRLERVNRIEFKQTKEPSRFYLRWLEPFAGREVIFELHKRGNRMLIHEGGLLRRTTPDFIMPMDHALAEKFSRHPVSDLRIQRIRRELRRYREDASNVHEKAVLVSDRETLRDNECFQVLIRFVNPDQGPAEYRRFDIFIDKETFLPLRWDRYDWDENGEEQLLEYFEIVNLNTDVQLTDEDFSPNNVEYDFRPDWVQSLKRVDQESP